MIDALRNGLLAGDAVSVGHRSLQSRAMDTRHFFVRGCRTARVRGAGRWHGRGAGARGRGANRRRAATARTGCGGRGRLVTPGAGLATALGTSCTDPTAHSCATLPASPRLRKEIGRSRPAVCAGPARTRCLPPPLPRHQHSPPADGSLHMGR